MTTPNPRPIECPNTIESRRNQYYVGKFFCPEDFQLEQDYFRTRRHLHHRLLHGWGIICGLEVDNDPQCPGGLRVYEGVAIDRCGREVILQGNEDDAGKWFVTLPPQESALPDGGSAAVPVPAEAVPRTIPEGGLLLCLQYWEKQTVPTKALCATTGEAEQYHDRVCEYGQLVWLEPTPEVLEELWGNACQPPSLEGCIGFLHDPCTNTETLIALAYLKPDEPQQLPITICDQGRRYLRPPTPTKIASVNWPHGGELKLDEVKAMGCQLRITFDGKLRPPAYDGNSRSGINKHTFVVDVADDQGEFDALKRVKPVGEPAVDGHSVAVLEFSPGILPYSGQKTFYVTLKCDFVIDENCRPVDGNHLRGSVPQTGQEGQVSEGEPPPSSSGDGVPGGVFHSWFTVKGD